MNLGNGFLITTIIMLIMALALFVRNNITGTREALPGKEQLFTARLFYYIAAIVIFFTVFLLIAAFIRNDFQYVYVHMHSSRDLAFLYKLAALWAGQEGSFLLWLFILNLLGIAVFRTNDEYENILLPVIIITQLFIIVSIVLESPFAPVQGQLPADGQGMNRVLMDPWMIAHPPLLYIGYASATILYAYAIAALIKRDYISWIAKAYPWTIFSMTSLGIGIFMGGYWSYTVLGWGGYWGWDPVENSSLVPWLVAVGLMHTMLLYKKKALLARTSIVLALAYFVLVMYSAYLTRSGILANFSVHSFSGSVGSSLLKYFILFYLLVSIGCLLLMKKNQPHITIKKTALFWEKTYIQGMIILLLFAAVILAGTSLPIISGLFNQPYSMKESKYNEISFFFGFILIGYMLVATTGLYKGLLKKSVLIGCITISVVLGVLFNLFATMDMRAYALSAIAFYMVLYHGYELMASTSTSIIYSRIAHIGVAVLIIGIVSSNFHSITLEKKLVLNKEEKISNISLTFKGLTNEKKSKAMFVLRMGQQTKNIIVDYYFDSRMGNLFREPYIRYGLFKDIYLTPKEYFSGMEKATTVVLKKGEAKKMGDLVVAFEGFGVKSMTTENPVVVIKLKINGRELFLTNFTNGKPVKFKIDIPGTGRIAALYDMDATKKIIGLYISPGKNTEIAPDSMTVEVSFKKLIWFVWLGTIFIAIGGLAKFGNLLLFKKENLP